MNRRDKNLLDGIVLQCISRSEKSSLEDILCYVTIDYEYFSHITWGAIVGSLCRLIKQEQIDYVEGGWALSITKEEAKKQESELMKSFLAQNRYQKKEL